jgi:hypothetical protein
MQAETTISHVVSSVPDLWLEQALVDWPWHTVAPLPALQLANGSGPALQQTVVRLCCSDEALYVRFDCQDRDIWATYQQDGDPIYNEEVVEIFIAPGAETPARYFEFEISPDGVVFAVVADNPHSDRASLTIAPWDVGNSLVYWESQRYDDEQRWEAIIEMPWRELIPLGQTPKLWRANFYRIERPRTGEAEFSCWSPTLTDPADFHKPERFGLLHINCIGRPS